MGRYTAGVEIKIYGTPEANYLLMSYHHSLTYSCVSSCLFCTSDLWGLAVNYSENKGKLLLVKNSEIVSGIKVVCIFVTETAECLCSYIVWVLLLFRLLCLSGSIWYSDIVLHCKYDEETIPKL